jgi:hypothetical protein
MMQASQEAGAGTLPDHELIKVELQHFVEGLSTFGIEGF